jgi:hypothetical protein
VTNLLIYVLIKIIISKSMLVGSVVTGAELHMNDHGLGLKPLDVRTDPQIRLN